VDASSFRFVVVLSLYFTPNFVISSLIVGTFKSAICQIYSGGIIKHFLVTILHKFHSFVMYLSCDGSVVPSKARLRESAVCGAVSQIPGSCIFLQV
jgi:hypothetical protein